MRGTGNPKLKKKSTSYSEKETGAVDGEDGEVRTRRWIYYCPSHLRLRLIEMNKVCSRGCTLLRVTNHSHRHSLHTLNVRIAALSGRMHATSRKLQLWLTVRKVTADGCDIVSMRQ